MGWTRVLALAALSQAYAKLPYDPLTDRIQHGTLSTLPHHSRARSSTLLCFLHALSSCRSAVRADCWAPDYCEPKEFYYRLCKLRLRGRGASNSEFACPEGEYCEELECNHKCWLPPK